MSLQDSANKFERVVGDNITLPCLYENKQSNVFWRHNISKNVFNIINDQISLEDQDTIFQNRTESLSSGYAKGDYSIMLKNVELIHAGHYTCFNLESNEEKKIQLFVKGTWNPCLVNYRVLHFHFNTYEFTELLLSTLFCFSYRKACRTSSETKKLIHGNTITEDYDFPNCSIGTYSALYLSFALSAI